MYTVLVRVVTTTQYRKANKIGDTRIRYDMLNAYRTRVQRLLVSSVTKKNTHDIMHSIPRRHEHPNQLFLDQGWERGHTHIYNENVVFGMI